MKNKTTIILLLMAVIGFSSCNEKRTIRKAASDFCDCLQPLADINSQLESLKSANNTDSMAVLIPIAKSMRKEAQECMEQKETEYGDLAKKEAFKEEAIIVIADKCPDVYDYLPRY